MLCGVESGNRLDWSKGGPVSFDKSRTQFVHFGDENGFSVVGHTDQSGLAILKRVLDEIGLRRVFWEEPFDGL